MSDAPSDEALMAAYVRGDRRAFETLFARWASRLHAFFRRSFADPTVADDLLQTTFLHIHKTRDRFDPSLSLKAWFFMIAARVRIDELRRHYRRPELVSDEELDNLSGPIVGEAERRVEAVEVATQVHQAVDRLPESQKVVIHLHRFEGMTFAEIAAVLETTEGAIKLRAFRAYERLRACLDEFATKDAKSA